MGAGALSRQGFEMEDPFGKKSKITVEHRYDDSVRGLFINYAMAQYGVLTDDSEKRFVLEQAWDDYFATLEKAMDERLRDWDPLHLKPDNYIDDSVLLQRLVLAYIRAFGHEILEEDFLKLHFACYDQNKDGFVTVTEGLLEAFRTIFKVETNSDENAKEWLLRKTGNKSKMNFDEFALIAKSMIKLNNYLTQVNFKAVFDTLDYNHDGLLKENEIKLFMRNFSNNVVSQYVIPEDAGFDAHDIQTILQYTSWQGTSFKEFSERLANWLAPVELPQEELTTEE